MLTEYAGVQASAKPAVALTLTIIRLLMARRRFCGFRGRASFPVTSSTPANATLSPARNRRISALVLLLEYGLSDRELAIWRQMLARQNGGEVIGLPKTCGFWKHSTTHFRRTVRYEGDNAASLCSTIRMHESRAPRMMFSGGDFDQRWGASGELYGARWIGRTLESLYNDGVPFQML